MSTSLFFDIFGRDKGVSKMFDDVAGKADGFGKKLSDIGKASGALAAGAVAIGMGSALNMDSVVRKMSAGLALGEAESERAGKVAGELYSQAYGDSMEDVTGAVGAVMSSIEGMATASESDLQGMTAKIIDFSTVMEQDVSRSAQVAGQMITTGLARDGGHAVDLLTAALAKVPVAVRGDVMDAIDEYGPMFAQLGFSGEQAMGMLVTASEKGMYGIDKTGDAVKEFTALVTTSAKPTVGAFESIGLNAAEMATAVATGGDTARDAFQRTVDGLLAIQDPAHRAQAAIALFGTPIEDLGTGDIPKFLESLQTAGAEMGNSAGAADRLGQQINDGPGAALKEFHRMVETELAGMVEGLIPVLTPALDKLKEFAPAVVGIVGVMGALAGITLIVNGGIAAYTAIVGLARGAVILWTGVQWLLNAALLANPLGVVVLAIGALVASVVIAYNNVGWFRDGVDGAWRGVQTAIRTVVDWFTGTVQPAFSNSLNQIKGFFEDTVKNIGTVWKGIEALAKAPISFVINTVINDGLIGAFNTVAGWIPGMKKLDRIRISGFAGGGYTGDGDKLEPKGVVHGGEFVFTKEETAKAGVPTLQRLAAVLRGFAGGGFVNPAPGAAVSSGYGPRAGGFHNGIDLAAAMGTPIRSAFGGRVSQAAWSNYGGGNEIKIDHPNGLQTWYAHLSRMLVRVGQTVGRGARIGDMGSTGNSTGSHLHFMVLRGGWPNHINPTPFLGAGGDVPAGGFNPIAAIVDGLIGSIRGAFSAGGMLTDIVVGIGRKLAGDMGGALFGGTGSTFGPQVFDQGGWLDSVGVNRSGKPEAVLTPQQSEDFHKFVNGGMRPVIYVQNPWTGEYMRAQMSDTAGQAIGEANDDIFRGRAR